MATPPSGALACAFLLAASGGPIYGQGSLTPPGAPAPTMKTLDQVEPRLPLDAAHTSSDANNDFIIIQRGSYYLTGNLTLNKATGIQVNVAEVTIDLNGFEITRTLGGSATCINITPSGAAVTIRNGRI